MSAYFSLPMYSASIGQRLRLIAGRCANCGTLAYPQRQVCMKCGGIEFTEQPLSGRGKIYTFTVIARGGAPAEFDEQQTMTGVIPVGIIELDEGPKIVGQLTGIPIEEIEIGMPVQAVVRRLYDQEGILRYGSKFSRAEAVDA